MILAFDVGYYDQCTLVAVGRIPSFIKAVDFKVASHQLAADQAAYEPGAFYKRELPFLLAALKQHDLTQVETIIIDGYVDLTPHHPGLGAYLFEALAEKVPVIGVAKSYFRDTNAIPILRGKSTRPLYVSSRGIDPAKVAQLIKDLPGPYRIPDFLKAVDQATRVSDV